MIDQDQAATTPAATPAPTAGIRLGEQRPCCRCRRPHGVQQDRFTIAHTAPGLRQLVAER